MRANAAEAVRRASRPGPLLIIALVCLILLAASTRSRVPVWKTRLSVAESTVRHAPGSARAWAALGYVHLGEGRVEAAETAFERALAIDPHNAVALEFITIVEEF